MKASKYLPMWLRKRLRPYSGRIWYINWRIRLIWWKFTCDARIRSYYDGNKTIKVSLGTGDHLRSDWLNTDYEPLNEKIVYVDVTKRFPFPDRSVDYFHTEHMIEHIPLSAAQLALNECYRTLKPGAKIRIATPDMMKLGRLLFDSRSPDAIDYANWALAKFPPRLEDATPTTPCMAFNNYMRSWGHQFIYDEATLRVLLVKAGFIDVRHCDVNLSDDPNLANQEMRQLAIGDAANDFETLVMEATKPN
jgi:predicted SAM-dependent methyltransferase